MGAKIFAKKRCTICRGVFKTSNDSDKCYSCILKEIAPNKKPTEAEKSEAEKISGCMSAVELVNYFTKRDKSK